MTVSPDEMERLVQASQRVGRILTATAPWLGWIPWRWRVRVARRWFGTRRAT